jgi:hypothetical protein
MVQVMSICGIANEPPQDVLPSIARTLVRGRPLDVDGITAGEDADSARLLDRARRGDLVTPSHRLAGPGLTSQMAGETA